MELLRFDAVANSREATIDRAHSVGRVEWVRQFFWAEGGPLSGSPSTTVELEIVGFIVEIICEPTGGDGAWTMLGVMSPFHVLQPGQFLQPVERAIFVWKRISSTGYPDFQMIETESVDYNDSVGEYYQPTAAHCEKVLVAYLDSILPGDLDPDGGDGGDA